MFEKLSRAFVVAAVALLTASCTTEPYKEAIANFQKGMKEAQVALINLDQRNLRAQGLTSLTSTQKVRLGKCELGQQCEIRNVPNVGSISPRIQLLMAQLVAYSNGLAELVAAKDTDAIRSSVGKINAAAQGSIKALGNRVSDAAVILASSDIFTLVADQYVEQQRLQALRNVIVRNEYRLDNAISKVQQQAMRLQEAVFLLERSHLQKEIDSLNRSASSLERYQLSDAIARQQIELNALAKADAGAPFFALRKAHRAVARALKNPNYSFVEASNLVLDFYEKSRALNDAIRSSSP